MGTTRVDGLAGVTFWTAASAGSSTVGPASVRAMAKPKLSWCRLPSTKHLFLTVAPDESISLAILFAGGRRLTAAFAPYDQHAADFDGVWLGAFKCATNCRGNCQSCQAVSSVMSH